MTREIDILVVEPGKAPRPARVVDTLDTVTYTHLTLPTKA